MVFSPGKGWTYSVGMDWMAILVCVSEQGAMSRKLRALANTRQISRLNGGISLGEYFDKNIFQPLGLRDTTFEPLNDPNFNDRLTGTHWRLKDGTLELATENAGDKYAKSSNHNGGGGLWSTADDLCKLLYGVFLSKDGPRILSEESIRQIFLPCLPDSTDLDERVEKMTKEQDINILPQIPPSAPKNFGLGVALNLEELDVGLSPGSAQWSGFPNCYWVKLHVYSSFAVPCPADAVSGLTERKASPVLWWRRS